MRTTADVESQAIVIEESQRLGEIPADITGSQSRVQNSDVHAIAGIQKKKRSEIALAVDRQGIHVYDIRQCRLITSYAVPPQTTFTSPPCSIRYRANGTDAARRVTYCSVKAPRPRILCFSETEDSTSSLQNRVVTASFDLDHQSSPIIHLDVLLTTSEGGRSDHTHLIAIHQDGKISCYAQNLESEEWSANTCTEENTYLELGEITSVRQARKGILKNREDVLLSLESLHDGEDSSLLVLLLRHSSLKALQNGRTSHLQVLCIDPPSQAKDRLQSELSARVRNLLTLKLPEQSFQDGQSVYSKIDMASGTLYIHFPGNLAILDLTKIVPVLVHTIDVSKDAEISTLRIAPDLLAVGKETSLAVIGNPHWSIQASRTIDFPSSRDSSQSHIRLLSYFSPSNTIVVLKGRRILTLQISGFNDKLGIKKRKHELPLAASIGKGTYSATKVRLSSDGLKNNSKSIGTYLPSSDDAEWRVLRDKLDAYHGQGDLENFFQMIALELSAHSTLVDQRVVSYLLSKVFIPMKGFQNPEGNPRCSRGLIFQEMPTTLLMLLLERGLLSTAQVQNSLQQEQVLGRAEILAPGAVVTALSTQDKPLSLLLALLESRVPMAPEELTQVLAIIMQRWDDSEPAVEPKLIASSDKSNGDAHSNGANGEEKALALDSPPKKAASTSQLLHKTLFRLSRFSQTIVNHALQKRFSASELLILVNIMRLEIAQTGWLSPYEDDMTSQSISSNDELKNITHLLNSIIDSIGTVGWTLGPGSGANVAETANTISYMRAEVSAALEGIEEAVYLGGLLGEALLCGKRSLMDKSFQNVPRPDDAQDTSISRPPKPLTIAPVEGNSSVLPIGLKLEQNISLTKVGVGGEIMERSRRDIGRMKSKLVGKYSFERIMV